MLNLWVVFARIKTKNMSAINQIEKEIREAVVFLRNNNQTIPSATIQFMKDASIEKLKQGKKLPIDSVVLSAYYVNPMGEPIIVLADNISDACDKLDKAGIKDYIFVHSHSFDVVH
jgi:hypothetical protein